MNSNKYIWINNKNGCYSKLQIIKNDINYIYIKINNELIKYDKKDIYEANILTNEDIINNNNLINLVHLNIPEILNTINIRYNNNMIYTVCSEILIAINPYMKLPIYNIEIMKQVYENKYEKPHIYKIADKTYKNMIQDNQSQSILMSGVSGSSKTYSATLALKYLTLISSNFKKGNILNDKIILASNILEIFGNAKTILNNNSSRYGRYTRLFFNVKNKLVGAKIETYLLEKTRVCNPNKKERNFHIFYLILKSLSKEEKKKYFLKNIKDYKYLKTNIYDRSDNINEKDEYYKLLKSFKILNFKIEEVEQIIKLISIILLLGELTIIKKNNKINVVEDLNLINLLLLLNIDKKVFLDIILYKIINTKEGLIKSKLNLKNVIETIKAISKSIYIGIFNWIVKKINLELNLENNNKNNKFIGILDIFGFEIFLNNNFEQLLINYSNEILQKQFNKYMFELEIDEYKKEKINYDYIKFPDNSNIINLFKNKTGLFTILNDLTQFSELKNPDKIFYNNFIKNKNNFLKVEKKMNIKLEFTIKHFAKSVTYCAKDFNKKNKDLLNINVLNLFENIKIFEKIKVFINKVYNLTNKKLNEHTILYTFEKQLNNLVKFINKTKVHYIRCIKPNNSDKPNMFIQSNVLKQLYYSGVLEAVKVARMGYPIRFLYDRFLINYRSLVKNIDISLSYKNISNNIIQAILNEKNIKIKPNSYQMGLTKIFLKKKLYNILENYKFFKLNGSSITLQKHLRCFYYKKMFKRNIKNITIIQNLLRFKKSKNIYKQLLFNKKSIIIQKYIRKYIYNKKYINYKKKSIIIQTQIRTYLYRKQYLNYLFNKKSIIIQKNIRKFLIKKNFFKFIKNIIIIQNLIRKYLAIKKKKQLRVKYYNIILLQKENKNLKDKLKKEIKLKENKENQIFELLIEIKNNDHHLNSKNTLFKNNINNLKKLNKTLLIDKQELKNKIINLQKLNKKFILEKKNYINLNNTLLIELNQFKKKNSIIQNKTDKKKIFNTQSTQTLKNFLPDKYNNLDKTGKRLYKNRIESNYLIVDQLKRDKYIKQMEISYKQSLQASHKLIIEKEKEINIMNILNKKHNNLLKSYKYKIESLENIIIQENMIKKELVTTIRNFNNFKK